MSQKVSRYLDVDYGGQLFGSTIFCLNFVFQINYLDCASLASFIVLVLGFFLIPIVC